MSRTAVIGLGGVGGYYGGLLARSGHEVHFLVRSHYEHYRDHGLEVHSRHGDYHLPDIHVWQHARDMPPCDLILVCIKTTANGHLLELLKPLARTGTDILLIQNGLGAEAMVQAAFPDSHVFGGLAFLCARKSDTRPGVIEHLDYGALKIGAWGCSKALAGRLAAIACRLSQAGIPVQTSDSLTCARWEKLVWNMPFNGLAVVLDKTTATILALQETREAVREHMLEVITVANLFGCPLSTELAETMIRNTDAMVDYTPSMLLDYRRGDQLELDYIYRNPIRAAVSAGADMPISRYLLGQLVQIQKTA